MGARPSGFKEAGGGGFLKNVDGTITGYRFTDEFNGVAFEPGKKPGTQDEKFHSLFFELHVRVDGAEEDITQNLFAGNYDAFDVSEDGLTIVPNEDGYELGKGTPFDKFISSLCAPGGDASKGFPEELLSETDINYEPIIGTRVRFGQAVNTDKDGKAKKRKVTKGKFKGREFDDTSTVVTAVYEVAKAGKKAAGKAAPKAAAKASSKAAAPAAEEAAGSDDLETFASETLVGILTAAPKNTIAKSKVSMAVLNAIMKDKRRDAVKKLLNSDEFLGQCNGWAYDADAKGQPITLLTDAD